MRFVPDSAAVVRCLASIHRAFRAVVLAAASLAVGGVSMSASAQPCPPHWEPGTLPGPNYFVFAAGEWDPDGDGPRGTELLLGGGFSIPGNNTVYGLATWDGTAYRGFSAGGGGGGGGPGFVRAIAFLPNGDLIVGGGFQPINGVPGSANIARWDRAAGTWNALGTGLGGGSDVESIAVLPDGRIVAAGTFFFVDGQVIRNLAIWDGTTWSQLPGLDWYPPLSTGDVRVSAIAARPNGDLIVAGYFGLAGGHIVDHIAMWNDQGWHPMAGGLIIQPGEGTQCYGVSDMALMPTTSGDQVVAAFNYTQPPTGLLILTSIYAWNGTSWRSLGSPYGGSFFGAAYAISPINDTEVAIGGNLNYSGESEPGRIARWNGSSWSWMGLVNSSSFVLHRRPSGELIAGGAFTTASGVPAPYWARWSTDGTLPTITQQPTSLIRCPSATAEFSVTIDSGLAAAVRWQIESAPPGSNIWANLTDGPALRDGVQVGTGSGATTSQYTFQRSLPSTDTLRFRAALTSSCGSVNSHPAMLSLCAADFNCDSNLGSQDFFDFIASFFNGAADFNHDGSTTSQDFFDFLAAFFAGC